jgi:hypothetical protein
MVFRFLMDPLTWIADQYTWFLHDSAWLVLANMAFWPALFCWHYVKAWLGDRRTLAESKRIVAEAGGFDAWWRKNVIEKRGLGIESTVRREGEKLTRP